MSDRHDEDTIWIGTIQQAVGKPGDQDSAESTTKRMAALRKGHQSLVRALYRRDEIKAEVLGLALVVLCRRDELRCGLGVKLDRLHRSDERAFSITRSAEMASTPERVIETGDELLCQSRTLLGREFERFGF